MYIVRLVAAGSLWHGYELLVRVPNRGRGEREKFQILVRVSTQIKQGFRKMVHFMAVQGF